MIPIDSNECSSLERNAGQTSFIIPYDVELAT